MVDKKITDLPGLTGGLAASDLIEVVRDPGGTPVSEKSTFTEQATLLKTLVHPSGQLLFDIDGQGSTITTGVYGYWRIPYDCTITVAELTADQTGSIVIDVWADSYANYPPTDADSITAAAQPTLSSAIKSTDSTLTGWTVTLNKGDYVGINVDSVTTCQKATLALGVTKT